MKVSIVLQDDSGQEFSGEAVLVPVDGHNASPLKRTPEPAAPLPATTAQGLNFELPLRALIKQHASGKSGPEKFALLVACMSKGDTSVTVLGSELDKQWSNMTAHMGTYNRSYPTRAKENGWVDSPKWGTYRLLPGWAEIMKGRVAQA